MGQLWSVAMSLSRIRSAFPCWMEFAPIHVYTCAVVRCSFVVLQFAAAVVAIRRSRSPGCRKTPATMMAGSSADQPQGRKRFRSRSLERAFAEEFNRTTEANRIFFRCYYCNAEIVPACLHIINNPDAPSLRESDWTMKTLHRGCFSPYLQNYEETNAKRNAERRSGGGNEKSSGR